VARGLPVIALVSEGETTEAAAVLGLGATVMSSGDESATA
jgi:hypothetical protein